LNSFEFGPEMAKKLLEMTAAYIDVTDCGVSINTDPLKKVWKNAILVKVCRCCLTNLLLFQSQLQAITAMLCNLLQKQLLQRDDQTFA
jgi:hypothetical protein